MFDSGNADDVEEERRLCYVGVTGEGRIIAEAAFDARSDIIICHRGFLDERWA